MSAPTPNRWKIVAKTLGWLLVAVVALVWWGSYSFAITSQFVLAAIVYLLWLEVVMKIKAIAEHLDRTATQYYRDQIAITNALERLHFQIEDVRSLVASARR